MAGACRAGICWCCSSGRSRPSPSRRAPSAGSSAVTPRRPRRPALTAAPPSALVVTGILSVQLGAGLADRLFASVTPAGVTGLRLWWSALILAAVGGRGVTAAVHSAAARRAWRDAAVVVAFGVVLGVMNFSIYQSFARIPLGAAVTIEFLGPLAVAVASSRRLVDLVWVCLAAGGVLLLTRDGAHLAGAATSGRELAGITFGLVAAASWAAYILLSRSTGRRFGGSSGLVIAMLVAAAVVTPAAVTSGHHLLRPDALAAGLAIGLLSSVIPYRLELEALRRVPARVFGIWMSLEPAVAALVGLVVLGQHLSWAQWLAICCVTAACAGAARGSPAAEPADAGPAGQLGPPPDAARAASASRDGSASRAGGTAGPDRPADGDVPPPAG